MPLKLRPTIVTLTVLCVALAAGSFTRAENHWPRWRGPDGTGHTTEMKLPVTWDASSVVWKTELKGEGQSSPVVWGERIFLTTAVDGGRQRIVLCVNRGDGKILWEQTAWTGEPEPTHKMNDRASATCATDGERVIAFFGRGGIHCYDFDGKQLWSRDLGLFEGPWGTAASPVIVDDLVIQNCDAEGDAYLIGLDKRTGDTVWKTPREKVRGWSTPVLIETAERKELLLNGEIGVNAYDPQTGADLWFCKVDSGRGETTVTSANGLVIALSGRAGDMVAVRPGGSGVVTGTREAWRTMRRGGRDLPSPIVVGDYLIVVNMQGIASCYDAISGKELWKERICSNISASPIAANGLLYVPSETGETIVVRPGKTFELVARNSLGNGDNEMFRASLAPSDGQIFCRSDRVLYCIGKRQTP
jgi:outer membrane protein assembly factor BamB